MMFKEGVTVGDSFASESNEGLEQSDTICAIKSTWPMLLFDALPISSSDAQGTKTVGTMAPLMFGHGNDELARGCTLLRGTPVCSLFS